MAEQTPILDYAGGESSRSRRRERVTTWCARLGWIGFGATVGALGVAIGSLIYDYLHWGPAPSGEWRWYENDAVAMAGAVAVLSALVSSPLLLIGAARSPQWTRFALAVWTNIAIVVSAIALLLWRLQR